MFSFFKKQKPDQAHIDAKAKPEEKENLLRVAVQRAKNAGQSNNQYAYPVKAPQIMPGVVPKGVTAPVLAMDYSPYTSQFENMAASYSFSGFPGFAYLSQLSTRPEYRAFASSMATEITREWIDFTSKQADGKDSSEKIKAIEEEFKRLGVREIIGRAAAHDSYFGRGQIYIDIRGHDKETPLILSSRTVQKGSLNRISNVEPIWTTPSAYNAIDPSAPDFYKPSSWYMLGQKIHASRMMTIITRELPDMLKPAFNFSGISLSQLAEPYVDNWLRTRQSVSNLINNFSITGLATSMDQVLQGEDDGTGILKRAELFTANRSNSGLMLLDKEREEIVQVNTPLSGLDHLQAQAQEHMCSVSRIPAMILTGISPSGLNASSEGEIRVFYDWISAQQESFYRGPIETILQVVQLSLFGEIDPDIEFHFVPLYQMTPKELADIRAIDGTTSCAYVAAGIIDPSEVREKLAKDAESGFHGLDTDAVIVPPNQEPYRESSPLDEIEAAQDAEFKEEDHPRAENGQFGSGGGGGVKVEKSKINTKNFKAAEKTIDDIERLSEKYGKVYIRWTADPKYDLKKDANSRDYVSGETHNGLSAVEVSSDDHPVDIADSLSEYMFLRLKDPKIKPVVYRAERVGTDSDGHATIRPIEVLMQPGADVLGAIDNNFAEIKNLQYEISKAKKRLPGVGNSAAKNILSEFISEKQNILNEKLAKNGINVDA